MLTLTKIKSIYNKIKSIFVRSGDKTKDKKAEKAKIINYCKPTSIQVKMLKKWLEEDDGINAENKKSRPECTYELFVDYLNKTEELGLPFPSNSIEKDLGISKVKRLKFCGQAVEEGILYKPTSNSFDWAKNRGIK